MEEGAKYVYLNMYKIRGASGSIEKCTPLYIHKIKESREHMLRTVQNYVYLNGHISRQMRGNQKMGALMYTYIPKHILDFSGESRNYV